MEQMSNSMRALQLALVHSRWRCGLDPKDPRILQARAPGRGYHNSLKFAFEDKSGDLEPSVVRVVDDARPYKPGTFFQLEDLHPGDAVDGSMRIRLGHDILFPFLKEKNSEHRPLQDYLKHVSETYLSTLPGEDNQLSVASGRSAVELSRVRMLEGDQRPYDEVSVNSIASDAQSGSSALIAFDPLLDRNAFFFKHLFEPHVNSLCKGSLTGLKMEESELARIPLYLSATDVRVLGLDRAFWEAGRHATGLALSSELTTLLIELGYFHIYMPDIGSLRTDYDLDPNTQHIGEIFAAAGQSGSFTMGCERELVFQGPVLGEAGAEEPFKTLGIRFFNASRLTLFDTGSLPEDRVQAELAGWHEFAEVQAERISRISESCLSPREMSEVLIRLGAIDNLVSGAGFSESDLERTLRTVLRGERLRPGNVRSAVAAVTNSGLFRPLAGGQLTIRSKVFATWLVSDGVFKALKALCYQTDCAPLDRALETANLPGSALQWALAMGPDTFVKDIMEAIPRSLLDHRFREGGEPNESTLIENLWSLLLAIAARVHARGGVQKGADVISELCGQVVKVRSLAMPQACFSGLNLTGWSFEDCRLRNASFLDCNLQNANMKDCLLSGATFERCDFGSRSAEVNFNSFAGSDISGADFKACSGLSELFDVKGDAARKLLERSIWTASSVVFDAGEDDKETISRAHAASRAVGDTSATAAGVKVMQLLKNGSYSAEETPWPASAARSFAHAQWGERPVTVKTPDAEAGLLVPKAEFVALLEKHFKSGKGTTPPAGTEWKAVSCLNESLDDQLFMAIDNEGHVWHAHVKEGCCTWRLLDFPLATGLAIARQRDGGVIAAIAHVSVADKATIATLDSSGVARDSHKIDLPFVGDMSAMCWTEVQREGRSYSELLVGPQGGGAFVVHLSGDKWRVTPFQGELSFTTINSFGYSPRENIAIACAQGGRVLGYRNIEAGRMEPLFSFHTAHEWFADVAMLNHQGQMLVAGLTGGEIKVKPMERSVLWALVQPFGNVVTIVSRSPVKAQIEPPIKLGEDSDRARQMLIGAQSRHALEVWKSLYSLRPEKESIEVSPILNSEVDFVLSIPQPYEGRLELPESFDDPAGNRFRSIELVIKGKVPNDETREFERQYTEAELDLIVCSGNQLRVRWTGQFNRKVRSEKAILTVSYPSADENRGKKQTWPFELQVEWEDNPFVSSGEPVLDDQFFGLDEEIADVVQAIQLGNNVIVRSSRRSGKSSFVRKVAQELRAGDRARVAVVVSGNDIATDGTIFRSIRKSLGRIGEQGKSDYRELAALDLPLDDEVMAFKMLADTAVRRGHEPPFTVFVDEWGYLKDVIGPTLANSADELRMAGVALCLTSTPSDFRNADSASQSNDYRFFSHKLDIGRLREDALRRLVLRPLEKRMYKIDEEVVQAVVRLSSGAPHDANILMHHALLAAKEESASRSNGDGSSQGVHIHLHHLLPRSGREETDALKNLEQKYIDLQEFLIAKLEPNDRELVLSLAGPDCFPTVEDPNPPPTAKWDTEPLGIPLTGRDGHAWRTVFAEAGYRVALAEGEKTDNGITPGPSAYKLWIPWGMAQYFRRLRRTKGGV
jgi:hypothetical protein